MRTLTFTGPPLPLTVIADGETVLAAGFAEDPAELAARLGLDEAPPADSTPSVLHDQVTAYLDGDVAVADQMALRQPGTDFQQAVWQALRDVPAGSTASYGELAAAIGRPSATRAVGSACGRNLIAPFVPCHRALRTDGTLGGYLYGLETKRWLLELERAPR